MTRTRTEALNSYVTDMLALEDHIDQALAGQQSDLQDEQPQMAELLRSARAMIARHVEQLERVQEEPSSGIGAGIAETLKRGVAAVAGLGAAAVDAVRSESVPKALRDDYAAFSLASVGYMMLHTTAASFGSRPIAAIAEACLTDYAQLLAGVRRLIPGTVLGLLRDEGLASEEARAEQILAWQEGAWMREPQVAAAR